MLFSRQWKAAKKKRDACGTRRGGLGRGSGAPDIKFSPVPICVRATPMHNPRFRVTRRWVMSSEKHNSWRVGLGALVVLVGCVLVARAEVPRGWFLAGSKPSEFEAGVDPGQAYQGHRSAYLKSKQLSVDGFGTLMQQFTARSEEHTSELQSRLHLVCRLLLEKKK